MSNANMTDNIVVKPWGYELIWAKTDNYVGKVLHINKGKRLSLQYHEVKEETIMVKTGILQLQVGRVVTDLETLHLGPGETYHIPAGLVHRMGATDGDCEVIEVSTPQLEDVVRLADDFSRTCAM